MALALDIILAFDWSHLASLWAWDVTATLSSFSQRAARVGSSCCRTRYQVGSSSRLGANPMKEPCPYKWTFRGMEKMGTSTDHAYPVAGAGSGETGAKERGSDRGKYGEEGRGESRERDPESTRISGITPNALLVVVLVDLLIVVSSSPTDVSSSAFIYVILSCWVSTRTTMNSAVSTPAGNPNTVSMRSSSTFPAITSRGASPPTETRPESNWLWRPTPPSPFS